MTPQFQPDLFSASRPRWIQASAQVDQLVRSMAKLLPAGYLVLSQPPEQIGALEINSSNLRLTSQDGCQIVLKRYPETSNAVALHKTLGLMGWLADQRLPVPKPLAFANGTVSVLHDGAHWAIFPFVDGDYFSGNEAELDAAAHECGLLASKLMEAPQCFQPVQECHHLSLEDNNVIEFVQNSRDRWRDLFEGEIADLLDAQWQEVWLEWRRVRENPIFPGPRDLAHLDLHPFNMLIKHGEIAALLDFDSCKMMPIGYALAFGAMKQCRQAVAHYGKADRAPQIGSRYLEVLAAADHHVCNLTRNFADLAIAEVFRRIAIIFRLNVQNLDRRWNSVLPIQIAHIAESKALFCVI